MQLGSAIFFTLSNCHTLFQYDQESVLKIDTSDQVRGVIMTLNGKGSSYDFMSRYFAPWVGIPDDPVCGSAHTVLAPYWSVEYGGRKQLLSYFASNRGGDVRLDLRPDHLCVQGHGTIVLTGFIHI